MEREKDRQKESAESKERLNKEGAVVVVLVVVVVCAAAAAATSFFFSFVLAFLEQEIFLFFCALPAILMLIFSQFTIKLTAFVCVHVVCVCVCVQLHCIHKNYKIIYGNLNKRIVSVVVVIVAACYCCYCSYSLLLLLLLRFARAV